MTQEINIITVYICSEIDCDFASSKDVEAQQHLIDNPSHMLSVLLAAENVEE